VTRQLENDEIAALRTLIRAAHEAIKDLNATIRDARACRDLLDEAIERELDRRIPPVVQAAMEVMSTEMNTAITETMTEMRTRFDEVMAILTNETDKVDGPSMKEYALFVRDLERTQRMRSEQEGRYGT
jgi:predicted transcriptional regulator